VVSGRGGDDPFRQGFPGLGSHEVEGSPDLEGAGPLEVLALEEQGEAESFGEVVGVDQFRAPDPLLEAVGRFLDQGVGEHRFSVGVLVIMAAAVVAMVVPVVVVSVPMAVAVMVVVVLAVAGAVAQFLDDRRCLHAPGALGLEGGVGDVVALEEEFLDLPEHLRLPLFVVGFHVHVGRQGKDVGADGPDVQVVDGVHPFHLRHGDGNRPGAHPPGNSLHQDVGRLPDHPPRAPEDDAANPDGDEGVQKVPVGVVHDDAADDDPHRRGRVADHVEKGAVDVQVVVGVAVEGRGGDEVHDEAHRGDGQHRETLDLHRVAQPLPCLVEDADGHEKDRGAVDEGGEDLGPVPAEGAGVGGGVGGELDGRQ